jgi:hypothetical protein
LFVNFYYFIEKRVFPFYYKVDKHKENPGRGTERKPVGEECRLDGHHISPPALVSHGIEWKSESL